MRLLFGSKKWGRKYSADVNISDFDFVINGRHFTLEGMSLYIYMYWKISFLQRASPILQRFVPFAAVCASNMVNIPLMRQR